MNERIMINGTKDKEARRLRDFKEREQCRGVLRLTGAHQLAVPTASLQPLAEREAKAHR